MEFLLATETVFCRSSTGKLQYKENPEAKKMSTVVCGEKKDLLSHFFLMAVILCAQLISEFITPYFFVPSKAS